MEIISNPIEQMIHSFLEMLPLFAVLLLTILHADRIAPLFIDHSFDATLDWSIRFKDIPLSPLNLSVLVLAILALQVLPYLEEIWRCIRWRARKDNAPTRLPEAQKSS